MQYPGLENRDYVFSCITGLIRGNRLDNILLAIAFYSYGCSRECAVAVICCIRALPVYLYFNR
jgi:hypothetical protein